MQVEMEAAGGRQRVQYQLERSKQGLSSAEKAAGPASPVTPPELPLGQDDSLQVSGLSDADQLLQCSMWMHGWTQACCSSSTCIKQVPDTVT